MAFLVFLAGATLGGLWGYGVGAWTGPRWYYPPYPPYPAYGYPPYYGPPVYPSYYPRAYGWNYWNPWYGY